MAKLSIKMAKSITLLAIATTLLIHTNLSVVGAIKIDEAGRALANHSTNSNASANATDTDSYFFWKNNVLKYAENDVLPDKYRESNNHSDADSFIVMMLGDSILSGFGASDYFSLGGWRLLQHWFDN